jgi:hypothetical protein
MAHQRLAPRLATRVRAQLAIKRGDLHLERIDDRDRDRDLLARRGRQPPRRKPLASLDGHQAAALRTAMVIQRCLDPLLPFAALLRQHVAQPQPLTQIEDPRRRDPGLGQAPDHQQLPQMPGVGAIALGALLWAPQPGGLRRLSQMRHRTDPVKLLDREPPARRRLQRHLEPLAVER